MDFRLCTVDYDNITHIEIPNICFKIKIDIQSVSQSVIICTVTGIQSAICYIQSRGLVSDDLTSKILVFTIDLAQLIKLIQYI